jgi:AraC-like DNA-binding protein
VPVTLDSPPATLPIPLSLRDWVVDARTPWAAQPPQPNIRVPDAATSLVFRTTAAGHSQLVVIGPQTRASYFTGKDLPTCVRLRLRPGRARPLLGIAPRDLVDRSAPLADFWGEPALALAERLAGAHGDPHHILAWLGAALVDRIPDQPRMDRSDLAVSATGAVLGGPRLDAAARDVAVSERHLRAVFEAEVGVSPKYYARIDRLRRVLAAARAPGLAEGGGWARLARDAGFYDQAHLTTDFRTMMGVPPAAFLRGHLPTSALASCATP